MSFLGSKRGPCSSMQSGERPTKIPRTGENEKIDESDDEEGNSKTEESPASDAQVSQKESLISSDTNEPPEMKTNTLYCQFKKALTFCRAA